MEPDAIYEAFSANGYCVVDSLFDPDELDRIKEKALENFNEIMGIITAKGLSFGVGLKEGYDEVVQRQAGRYEVPYKMNDSFHALASNEKLLEIVHRILGDDIKIVNESLIISMQGTTFQSWHADGPHCSVSEYLPCHCLNVFIPLVDVTEKEGPTEFRPTSHFMTRDLTKLFLLALAKKKLPPTEKPNVMKGSALLFDYRVLHRGTPNISDYPRPVYVLTFAKPWHKDLLNYPKRSVFDTR